MSPSAQPHQQPTRACHPTRPPSDAPAIRHAGAATCAPRKKSGVRSAAAGRGRGRGRGRGGAGGGARGATTGVQEFIPTTLGVALVEGYENMGFETSLTKPFLRKEVGIGRADYWCTHANQLL